MTEKNNDLTKIIKKEHEGNWIALSPDQTKVIAFSADIMELEKQVGDQDVVYMKALSRDVRYAFFNAI